MGNSASTELPRRSAHFPPHSTAVNRETRQSCKRSNILYESFRGLSIVTFPRKPLPALSLSTWQRRETCQKLSECRLDAFFAPWYNFTVKRETLMTDGFVEHHME